MIRIYKYQLNKDRKINMIPTFKGAEIINADLDLDGKMCIWAIIDDEAERVLIPVGVYWTGEPIVQMGKMKYVGMINDGLIWHVIDYGEVSPETSKAE